MIVPLDLPKAPLRLKKKADQVFVWCEIRKMDLLCTPEEWVRQHLIHYLISEKNYPTSLINVEKQLEINGLKKRYDVVVFNSDGSIEILVECKAPEIEINQTTFDQIARYNMNLKANYLIVTNGLKHFYCKMDFRQEKYTFLRDIPDFSR